MHIYLLRHGEALSRADPSITSDSVRPLTDDGIKRTRQSAQGLANLGVELDAVFSSPWLRARQTAAITCETLGIASKLHEMEELAGDRTVEEVMNVMVRKSQLEHVMLVGHNPLLSDLASYLLCLSTSMQIDLKKSGVCAIEVERIPPKSPGVLLWMMTARQLRSIG